MPDKLKIGIVGCGAVARERHIPGFLKVKGKAVLQAACDKNENLAREIAGHNGISGVYSDISEMLDRERLDIVDICVPQQIHAPLAIEALERGCHVLIEKPMALKTTECDAMIKASRKSGARLCLVHNVLFHSPFLRAKELVARGAIGTVTGMRIFLSDHRDEVLTNPDHWIHGIPGGLLGETGPHVAYMSLAFINKVNRVDVFARSFRKYPWAPFDEFRIEMEGEQGLSSILISYTSNHHNAYVDILGTEGALHLDLNSMLLIRQGQRDSLKPVKLALDLLGTGMQIAGGVASNVFKVLLGQVKLGHDVIIERFVDSVRDGTESPVTEEEGRETTRIVEMMVERLYQKYGSPEEKV